MANRAWLEQQSLQRAIPIHIWGNAGENFRRQIESSLDVSLGNQIANFVDSVGNVGIGGQTILLAGGEDNDWNCNSETHAIRNRIRNFPRNLILIVNGEECHFYNTHSECVESYESVPLQITPGSRLNQLDTFDDFVLWLMDRAALAMSDAGYM